MSSFGDFAAFSDPVDMATALVLKSEVSDGLIAPGFEPGVLEILTAKKGGNYIVLEADPEYAPPEMELKEVFGVVFQQRRNDRLIVDLSVRYRQAMKSWVMAHRYRINRTSRWSSRPPTPHGRPERFFGTTIRSRQ